VSHQLSDQYNANVQPGPHFTADCDAPLPSSPAVQVLAFYLPQFHAIPENDSWWGKGFTEWTNVTKALPRFKGHYQPHLPGEFGFYDPTQASVLRRQAALAKRYGISGFCIYSYWFGGKQVLERPLQVLLDNPDIDFPFCLCWANENWTRTWDGSDQQILLAQSHSAQDDLDFARSIEPAMRDPRYIRVDGRPLLLLYRPSLLPDARATVARWREHFQSAGLGNPYIAMVHAYSNDDPHLYGMDAAVGFPPHGVLDAPPMDPKPRRFAAGFVGQVISYDTMVARTLAHRPSAYRFMPGVCVSWDNDARRPGRGLTFHGSTPAKYGSWLAAACRYAITHNPPAERMVFVNAWNEWAEGTHLEPDRHFGYAYLAQTRSVLNDLDDERAMQARLAELPIEPIPSPLRRARKAVRGVLGRVKRSVVSMTGNGR
jgi:lipopolysaccharide biosynthesis protein